MKCGFFLLVGLFSNPAFALDYLELAGLNPSTQYRHFETQNFEFTFQEGYLKFTEEAAQYLEQAHEILSPLMKWKPRKKTHVLIIDNTDSANGFAMASLRVGMVLFPVPPEPWYSTSYTENWIKLLVFHEYTHILNLDPTTSWIEALRVVFGDGIRPNSFLPSWMLEGLAVYFETRTSKLGRGRSPYYDAILRSYFHEDRLGTSDRNGFTYGRLSGDWPYFPGGETSYLFGYQIWNQFAKDLKNDSMAGEYSLRSSGRVPFFIDGNLENLSGKTWSDYWDAFVLESKGRYQKEIEKVKQEVETRFTQISDSQLNAMGGAISPDGQWLAYTEIRLDERQGLILKNLKTGKSIKIKDKVQGALVDFSPDSRFLLFSSLGRDTTFTEFSDLWSYELESGSFTQLSSGLRAKDPQFSKDGKNISFVSVDHGTNILKTAEWVLQNETPALGKIGTVYTPGDFAILGTPRWTDQNTLVFSLQEWKQPESRILKIDPIKKTSPEILVQNGKMNRYPVWCQGELYYVSDLTGIDNVYSSKGKLTNVIGAVQLPFCSNLGDLFGSVLTSQGFDIARIEKKSPLKNPAQSTELESVAPRTLSQALEEKTKGINAPADESYAPWGTLAPRQWAPFAYLNYDGISGNSIGGLLLGFDTTGKHQYLGTFSYLFKSRTFDEYVAYTYYGFRPAITFSAQSATYDIASDSNRLFYKRTHELKLELNHLTRWTWSYLRVIPHGFIDWNSKMDLNSQQRVASTDPEFNLPNVPGGGLEITFSDEKFSKLGFISEGGAKITGATQARVYPGSFTLWKYLCEFSKFYSPGSHHVLNPKFRFLGSSHPYGLDRSFALLKGKKTNDPFDRGTRLDLNQIQLRGYPNAVFGTRSSYQASLDYLFPLTTVFNGSSSIFLNQAYGFVFAESTYVPSTKIRNLFLPAFGFGATLDTQLLWHFPLSISLEMHYGTRRDFGGDSSFFITVASSAL